MEESCRNTRQFTDEESFPIDLISTVTAYAIRLEDYENLKNALNKEAWGLLPIQKLRLRSIPGETAPPYFCDFEFSQPQLLTDVKHSLELLGFKVLPLLDNKVTHAQLKKLTMKLSAKNYSRIMQFENLKFKVFEMPYSIIRRNLKK